ncbi:MAG: FAD-binding protein [Spirochaetota bacterium]
MYQGYKQLSVYAEKRGLELKESFPLKSMTPLRVGGVIDRLLTVSTEEDLLAVHEILRAESIPSVILGDATNILLSERGFQGVALRLKGAFTEMSFSGDTCTAGGGVGMEVLSRRARMEKLSGLEFASTLPGTVGGATAKNATCFGISFSDIITRVRSIAPDGTIEERMTSEIRFGERESDLGGSVVIGVTMQLEASTEDNIQTTTEKYRYIRGILQPSSRSSGLIFKDPPGNKAYKMIERVGAANLVINGAKWYKQFPNYIVSSGTATADDVYRLIVETQKLVYQHYNAELNLNLLLLGEFGV